MKNIFKKNQIIITALAIMIVIAGYISFTNKDKVKTTEKDIQTMEQNVAGKDVLTEKDDEKEVAQGTTTNDTTGNTTTTNDTTKTTANTTITPTVAPASKNTETDELGDISDDDILKTAKNVTDTNELEQKEKDVPGEAVLASTTLDSGFFSSQKLEREQVRASNKETLMAIINSGKLAEADKKEATKKMVEITEIATMENATEILLRAKGFEDAIVSINDGKADVVVNASNITKQQLAIIENIVKTKTNFDVKNIHINPVVVSE